MYLVCVYEAILIDLDTSCYMRNSQTVGRIPPLLPQKLHNAVTPFAVMEYTNCSQEAQQVTKFICYREGKLPILGPTALPPF